MTTRHFSDAVTRFTFGKGIDTPLAIGVVEAYVEHLKTTIDADEGGAAYQVTLTQPGDECDACGGRGRSRYFVNMTADNGGAFLCASCWEGK